MDVKQIVEGWLTANGYNGLYVAGECACRVGDLMPCDGICDSCEAGVFCECHCPEDCECSIDDTAEFHIGPKKEG